MCVYLTGWLSYLLLNWHDCELVSWFEVPLLSLLLGNSLFAGSAGHPAVAQQLPVAVLWFPNHPAGLLSLPPASHRTWCFPCTAQLLARAMLQRAQSEAESGETGAGGGVTPMFPSGSSLGFGHHGAVRSAPASLWWSFRARHKQSLSFCRQTSSPQRSSSAGLAAAVGSVALPALARVKGSLALFIASFEAWGLLPPTEQLPAALLFAQYLCPGGWCTVALPAYT